MNEYRFVSVKKRVTTFIVHDYLKICNTNDLSRV